MADPTREQAIEAISVLRCRCPCDGVELCHECDGSVVGQDLLTRDGRLRERAMELIQQWRQGRAFIILATECADELEAALKEGEK